MLDENECGEERSGGGGGGLFMFKGKTFVNVQSFCLFLLLFWCLCRRLFFMKKPSLSSFGELYAGTGDGLLKKIRQYAAVVTATALSLTQSAFIYVLRLLGPLLSYVGCIHFGLNL